MPALAPGLLQRFLLQTLHLRCAGHELKRQIGWSATPAVLRLIGKIDPDRSVLGVPAFARLDVSSVDGIHNAVERTKGCEHIAFRRQDIRVRDREHGGSNGTDLWLEDAAALSHAPVGSRQERLHRSAWLGRNADFARC